MLLNTQRLNTNSWPDIPAFYNEGMLELVKNNATTEELKPNFKTRK